MKKVLALAMISACAVGGWRVLRGGDEPSASHDKNLVADRIWIDHMPKHDRDTISAFAALGEESVGLFQTSSAWKGHFELFRFEQHGDELRVVYPQSGEREQVKAIATKCDVADFDYCLEIAGTSRGVGKYYSRKGWEIDAAARPDDVRGRVEALVQAGAK